MHIKCFRIENFRRLKSALVQLEADRTIFVGANNSGKTSATHLFQMFLGTGAETGVAAAVRCSGCGVVRSIHSKSSRTARASPSAVGLSYGHSPVAVM